MSQTIENAKSIATIAAPFINQIISIWIKPKLEEMHKRHEIDKDLAEFLFEEKFEDYLKRSYNKFYYMNTIVFQNQQKSIDSLYLPLTVKSEGNTRKTYKLDEYKDNFIPAYKKVLITDTAGMGKSTIVKWLFLSCIKLQKGVPVFLELRKLSNGKGVLDEIFKELNPIDTDFNKDFILKLIKKGDFIFFFDGYDEIPLKDREEVTRNLQDFISKAGNNFFVVTSRPEAALAAFGDFQQFKIQPLKKEEAYELIEKHGDSSEFSLELIKKIKEEKSIKNLHEFLTNPMLVSLLFKAYYYKPTIPNKKQTFYRQVYDALFDSHDLTKGGSFVHEKHSKLDIEDFHWVLRHLGFITYRQGKLEFDRDELISLIRESRQNCPGLDFKESDFLRDLVSTVPLFNKEGEYYRWSHKSIQEYFVAQFIYQDSKENQEKILFQMYKSPKSSYYINVLDLYYDIDYKTFRKVIILDLVNQFIDYCNSTYTEIDRSEISSTMVLERQKIISDRSFALLVNSAEKDPTQRRMLLNTYRNKVIQFDNFKGKDRIDIFSLLGMSFFYSDGSLFPNLGLLYNKNERIVDGMPLNTIVNKAKFNLPFKHIDVLPINDDKNSPLNSSDNFDKVTKVLSIFPTYTLNLNECISMRNEILDEISKSQTNNFLLE